MRTRKLSLLAALTVASVAVAQQPVITAERMVLATGTVCRTIPDPQSPIANRYHIGDVIRSSKQTSGFAGRLYYFDQGQVSGYSPTCWVEARETIPYDWKARDVGLAAVADSLLARRTPATFDELVELITVFEDKSWRGPNDKPIVERSPLAQFKRLQLIERAAGMANVDDRTQPLRSAWLQAHRQFLFFIEGPNSLVVPSFWYRQLADSNRAAAWAEDAFWVSTNGPSVEEECYVRCHLAIVLAGPAVYWGRYPTGKYMPQALSSAEKTLREAISVIKDEAYSRADVQKVRASLPSTRTAQRDRVVTLLDSLDQRARPN